MSLAGFLRLLRASGFSWVLRPGSWTSIASLPRARMMGSATPRPLTRWSIMSMALVSWWVFWKGSLPSRAESSILSVKAVPPLRSRPSLILPWEDWRR